MKRDDQDAGAIEVEQHLHGEWSWTVGKPGYGETFRSTSTDDPQTFSTSGSDGAFRVSFAANAEQAIWISAGRHAGSNSARRGRTRRRKDYRVVGLVGGADAETLVVMLQAAMSFCRLVWIG